MSNPTDPDVDIVSSDGVQFRVRKSLLSLASPVFSDMFSIPQPNTDLPINLSEPGKTIKLILILADSPPSSLLIDSLSDIASLLQAADKYDIKSIQEHALYSLRSQPKFLENEPLRVYAIASRYGAYDTATLAARHVLRYPLLHAKYFSELEIVDGGTIYRVLDYHKRCTAAALEIAVCHTWIVEGAYVFMDCPEAKTEEYAYDQENTAVICTRPSRECRTGYMIAVFVHPWWIKFMDATKVALSKSNHSETIRDKGRVIEALSSASQCSHCRSRINSDFSKFLDAFVNEVEARVNKIKLVQPGAPQTDDHDDDSWDD